MHDRTAAVATAHPVAQVYDIFAAMEHEETTAPVRGIMSGLALTFSLYAGIGMMIVPFLSDTVASNEFKTNYMTISMIAIVLALAFTCRISRKFD